MLSPGNDEPCPGQVYILSILNTDDVLEAINGQDMMIRRYRNSPSQQWRLDPHLENRLTFVNVQTGHCLGANPANDLLCCKWDNFEPAEQFTMIPQKTGGYRVYNHWGNRPRVVTRQGAEDFLRTTTVGDAFVTIGVHCVE